MRRPLGQNVENRAAPERPEFGVILGPLRQVAVQVEHARARQHTDDRRFRLGHRR